MQTALNNPDDRNNWRFSERPIIRIVRESAGGKDSAGEKPRAYMWVIEPRRRPDRKWLEGISLH